MSVAVADGLQLRLELEVLRLLLEVSGNFRLPTEGHVCHLNLQLTWNSHLAFFSYVLECE